MPTNDRLDRDLIRDDLKTKDIGGKVLVYDRTSMAPMTSRPSMPAIRITTVWWSLPRSRRPAGAAPMPRGTAAGAESLLFSFALVDCRVSSELLSLTCGGRRGGGHRTGRRRPGRDQVAQ